MEGLNSKKRKILKVSDPLKIVFIHENLTSGKKNLKHRKIILLINFIFDPTFFLIASYQILKNYAILINHESFFQRKDLPQLHRF